jgi:lysyl-tRNA synthetase class 1
LEIADPEIYRMLILRTNPMKHISLRIEELPQYIDYFERMEKIYYSNEAAESNEELSFSKYLYPLVKVDKIKKSKPIRIPFNLLTFFAQLQNILGIEKLYQKVKAIMGNGEFEKKIKIEDFEFLLNKAFNWVNEIKYILEKESNEKVRKSILNKVSLFTIPEAIHNNIIANLDKEQLKGVRILREYIAKNPRATDEEIQNTIFKIAQEELGYPPKKLFEAIYTIILGRNAGPRLGSFLVLLDRNWLLERLNI